MKIKDKKLFWNLILEALFCLFIIFFFIVKNFDVFSAFAKEVMSVYPEFKKDCISFSFGEFKDGDDSYSFITYDGRDYILFGTTNKKYSKTVISECIGYIVKDENSSSVVDLDDKNWRVYTLKDDTDNNFLMDYDITTNLMNQPSFYRAIDTKDRDIVIPRYIDSLGYDYWS